MKRDFDLIKLILERVESTEAFSITEEYVFDDYNAETINEHFEILIEAGLIQGNVTRYMDGTGHHIVERLTWNGHEFLASMKDDTVWQKVREKIVKPAGGVTFEILKELLKQAALERFGISI